MFLSGLNFKEFMNDYREWHAAIEGFCDGFWPWPTKHKPTKQLCRDIANEHHYYNAGRVLGFVGFVVFVAAIHKWVT